jgi:multidrug resistance efflux pump
MPEASMSKRTPHPVAAVVVLALLAGWTTFDRYTREEKTSNATMRAAIGAAA